MVVERLSRVFVVMRYVLSRIVFIKSTTVGGLPLSECVPRNVRVEHEPAVCVI